MFLSELQRDILTEIFSIGAGHGADVLNSMTQSHIHLQIPLLKIVKFSDLYSGAPLLKNKELATVNLPFHGKLTGAAFLVFPTPDALKLVSLFINHNDNAISFDAARRNAMNEIGNIVLNAVIGSVANVLDIHFQFAPPQFAESTQNDAAIFGKEYGQESTTVIVAQTRFVVEDKKIEAELVILLQLDSLDRLIELTDAYLSKLKGPS